MIRKNLNIVILLFLALALSACQNVNQNEHKKMEVKSVLNIEDEQLLPTKDLKELDRQIAEYIARDKFVEGSSPSNPGYPGLRDKAEGIPLNALLNLLAKTFQKIAHHNPSVKEYQTAIGELLTMMDGIYLDSEDQDQFCFSIEALMDIVGLESSGGLLNTWRYGFDPTKMMKEK